MVVATNAMELSAMKGITFDEKYVPKTTEQALALMKKAFRQQLDNGVFYAALRLYRNGSVKELLACAKIFALHERWKSALDCFLFVQRTDDMLQLADALIARKRIQHAAQLLAYYGDEHLFEAVLRGVNQEVEEPLMRMAFCEARSDRAAIMPLEAVKISLVFQRDIEALLEA